MGRALTNRLISGSQVAANLLLPQGNLYTPCEIQPTSEYQIRPLAILNPEQQCEVWKEAVKTADGNVRCQTSRRISASCSCFT